jgi:hypothetical protein
VSPEQVTAARSELAALSDRLLGHSTVTVTTRYTHTNLDSKRAAVAKLASVRDSLVTVAPKYSNKNAQLSQMAG